MRIQSTCPDPFRRNTSPPKSIFKAYLGSCYQYASLSQRSAASASTERSLDSEDTEPSQSEFKAIFGRDVERKKAVDILLKLQEQRRLGTLDQELDFPKDLLEKGLKYLRKKYPLDEEAALIARIDRELDGEWNLPQKNTRKSRSAKSGLDEIRRINREKYEAQKAAREAEEKAKEAETVKANAREGGKAGPLVTKRQDEEDYELVTHPGLDRPMAKWVARYYDEAHQTSIPQMTKAQRLLPSAAFTVGAIGFALFFAHVYIPPAQSMRLFPDLPAAAAAVGAIVAINLAVFVAWRLPWAWKTLNKNFMVVPAIPKPFSMLGAEFSHQEFSHLLSNMLGVWFVGTHCTNPLSRLRRQLVSIC